MPQSAAESADKTGKLGWREQLIEDRRRASEQALWGVPGISIAAQAFLFNTGLAPSGTSAARLVVGIVGLVTASGTALVVAGQGSRLAVMRSWLAKQTSIGSARRLADDLEAQEPLVRLGERLFVSPVVVWLIILTVFALVDLLVIVAAAVALAGGGHLFGSG